jgi:non-specific serine/threonine protein kinase
MSPSPGEKVHSKEDKKSSFGRFIARLRKRRIIETLVAFIGGGWLLVEVVERLFVGHYKFPEKTIDLTVVSVIGALLSTLIWRWSRTTEKRPGNIKVEVLLVPLIFLATFAVDLNVVLRIFGVSGKMLLLTGIGALCLGVAWVLLKSLQWAAAAPPAAKELVQAPAGSSIPVSAGPEKSIVVLPFSDLSPQKDQEYFCDGMTEEIITDLSRVHELLVISRSSAMTFKGTKKTIPEIARTVNARYVMEGSVRKAGNDLRITAQLIDAKNDAHIWAEKYSGALDDVFEIQEKVSRAIVMALEVHLSPQEDRKLAARPLPSAAAYDSYLRAYQEIMLFEPEALKRAEHYLRNASEIVGEHPLLLAGLSLVRFQSVNLGLGQDEALKEARDLAERALAMNATLAQAHSVLAMICMLEGDFLKAIDQARKARAEAPGNTAAWSWLSWYYLCVGKVAAAARLNQEIRRLDPLDPVWNYMDPLVALFSGDFESGARRLAEAHRKSPDSPMWQFWEAVAQALAGHTASALEALAPLTASPPVDSLGRMGYMLRAVLAGDSAGFDAQLTDEVIASLRRDPQYSYHLASFTAALGRREEALDWLENAVGRTFVPVTLFESDPFLAPLRTDPRFERILARARCVQASVPDEP